MSKLIKIHDVSIEQIKNPLTLEMIGSALDDSILLSALNDLAGKAHYVSFTEAVDILDDLNLPRYFFPLYDAFLSHIWWIHRGDGYTEKNLYPMFKACCSDLIPGAKVIPFTVVPGHIPDFMIALDGRTLPVEIKQGNFSPGSLLQLQRYMKAYTCEEGVALGKKILCDLPENIHFIKTSVLEEAWLARQESQEEIH